MVEGYMEMYKMLKCIAFFKRTLTIFLFRVRMTGMVIPIQIEGGRSPAAKSVQQR